MWINRHKLNNSLVVFIHGIFGNYWATWRGAPALIQHECLRDALIRSYDMYLFGYDTKIWKSPPIRPDAVDQLRNFLDRCADKYRTVVLIAHSQGGILAKLYVLHMLAEAPNELKVDLLVTLGTPHRGRVVLVPLLWLQNTPLLGRLVPCRQLGQLASLSDNVRRLKQEWSAVLHEKRPSLRSLAIVGSYDRWVSKKSAGGFEFDTVAYLSLGHPALAKPVSAAQPLAERLLDELKQLHKPVKILTAIRQARADPTVREGYLRRNVDAVTEVVLPLGLDGAGTEIKTASLLMDFLRNFERRPLRKLEFDEAVVEYARRQVGDEI